ncbi:MAG: YicC/YloC family endoribonuclease [Pseudomonadota bacterium]
MINSMTAFARAEKSIETLTVIMEIRAYNSKNLDIAVRMPSGYQPLEEKIKGVVAQQVMRGRIEISCQLTQGTKDAEGFEIDTEKARAYHRALIRLKDELGLAGDISLDHLMAGGNIIRPAEKTSDMDSDWPVIHDCLQSVLGALCVMRATEGANLAADLSSRLELIENRLESIEAAADGLLDRYRDRLAERIQVLTKGVVEIDAARIAQEAAMLADRSDISEELIRARSHLQQFRSIMAEAEASGRKLNFLLQEFNREFNTMGAKAGNAAISHTIVEVKSELEKMREQVQNIE